MNFIISIDLGSTFSGSCYTEYLSGVINICEWKHLDKTYEKNPSVCLYTKQNPPRFITWGFDAIHYVRHNPEDHTVFLVRNFKHTLFTHAISRVSAVNYLRELYKYTCTQIIANNNSNVANPKFTCVLTVPDIWTEAERIIYRAIAAEAGIPCYPKEILLISTEAEANAVYCERYLLVENIKEGDSFMMCDIGGYTTSLSVYEVTNPSNHCQLYQETFHKCGSYNLEKNMNLYLRAFSYLSLSSQIREALTEFAIRTEPIFSETGEANNEHEIKLLLSHTFDQFLQSGKIESLYQTHQEEKKKLSQNYNQYSIELRIKCIDIARQVFDPFINNIISRLESALIQSPDTTRTIFLSGGCSESTYIFKRIHDHFTLSPIYASQGIQVVRKQGERVTMMGGINTYLDFFQKIEKITNYIQIYGALKSTHSLTRQTARAYGIQIVTYPLEVSTNDFELESVVSEEESPKAYKCTYFVPSQDIKNFYELISQNTSLPVLSMYDTRSSTWEFQIYTPCYVVINLYAYMYDAEVNTFISRENFIRLHRFRIPVYDTENAIAIQYRVDLYSLLFSVFHDRYISDYRCTDLMYTLY